MTRPPARTIEVAVNGETVAAVVADRKLLCDFLREDLSLTGTHVGCEHGVCGACTVLVDGRPVRSCLMLAVQSDGRAITTIEGVAGADGSLHPVQRAFHEQHALQCGFCTAGFIMSTIAYLDQRAPDAGPADETEVREHLAGTLCRCTGYTNIVRAVCQAAAELSGAKAETNKTVEPAREASLPEAQTFIGQNTPRKEDRRFVIGKGRFADDMPVSGLLHAAFVRSPHAHARIRSINVSAALKLPGVVAVITGRELVEFTLPFVCRQPGAAPMEMDALPVDKARFAGDPVACVVAVSRYVAEDGVDLVEVDWDVLPPVLDMYHAADLGMPLVDEKIPSNMHSHETFRYGDVDAAFTRADRVVKAKFCTQRLTHAPMETRSVVALWDEGREELTYYGAAQTAHILRTTLAARLGLSENQVRVISPDVGGGFGQKLPLYREEFTVAAMAMRLKRPIKWVEDRLENLTASNHARDDSVSVEVAVLNDGTVLGVRADLWADFGAYAFYPPSYIISVVGWLLLGAYKIENYEYTINVAITNKCPAGTLRAPMAIVTWATDGMMHRVAEELGLDPIEVRRKNMISLDDQPYRSAPGYLYEALTLRECFDQTLAAFDIEAFRREQAEAAKTGRLIGVGIANVVEPTTYGSAWYKASGDDGSGHEAATVKLEPTGAINVMVGIVSTGQGYETSLAQVVAEALGSNPANVDVRLGDTHIVPYGMGSRGSRGAAAGHGVAYLAALDLRENVLKIGAHLLQRPKKDLRILNDVVVADGDPAASVSVREIARIAYNDPTSLPDGMLPGLEIHRTYDPPFMTFSNATHLCQVEVDAETGRVTIVKYRVLEDAGTLINPMIVDGQVHGGVSMGIGQALLEEILYDDAGTNLSATFANYLLPTMDSVPMIVVEHIETPNPNTPRGIKGMSEGPVQGAIACVALAVQDAVARAGGRVEQLPITPSRMLGILRTGQPEAEGRPGATAFHRSATMGAGRQSPRLGL